MSNKNDENYINREISWLEFNQRVLDEAEDTTNPLLERLKFLSIVSSNLEEFFMVRVASIYDQVKADFIEPDIAGLTPKDQLRQISKITHTMLGEQYKNYHKLIVELKKQNIYLLKYKELTSEQEDFAKTYFHRTVYPVLTPMVVDSSRPFPLIMNKTLNIALFLEGENSEELLFGTIQVPAVLNRILQLPAKSGKKSFILLEDIIKAQLHHVFTGYKILTMGYYRVTRNADLTIDEEGAEDLLELIEQNLKLRKWGSTIKIEIEKGMDERLVAVLRKELECMEDYIFTIDGPLGLTFLMKLSATCDNKKLKYPELKPARVAEIEDYPDIFEAIKAKDILIHHPYQSFDVVVKFIDAAAGDPLVLAIKQILYRVSGDSPIIKALIKAAENGKQVTVLVEIKARFDEKNNIQWAKRLEQAGCHVIYGLVGLKVHGKILLVVRKEEDGIKRYVHLGTGNYNDVTARIYTDLGLFTANAYFGEDASKLFNMLSGYSQINNLNKLIISPEYMRKKFIYLIKNEEDNARKGKKAWIYAKLNSLVDHKIIDALYAASNAGVKIELIIRGICCLRPGINNISENIHVRSIVGRFLEHSRVYCFCNDQEELIYLSSADWMTRNLDRRVEILFPIEDVENRKKIKELIELYLRDNMKAKILLSSGSYISPTKLRSQARISVQKSLLKKRIKEI